MIKFSEVVTHRPSENSENAVNQAGAMEVDRLLSSTTTGSESSDAAGQSEKDGEGTFIGRFNSEMGEQEETQAMSEEANDSEMSIEAEEVNNDAVGYTTANHANTQPLTFQSEIEYNSYYGQKQQQQRPTTTFHQTGMQSEESRLVNSYYSADSNLILSESLKGRINDWQKFSCSQCNSEFTKLHRLKDHINSVHYQMYRFQCSECTYTTNRKYDLTRHQRCHAQEN